MALLPPIFFLDTKSTSYVLLSLHSFAPRKNIPVLVSTTHRKREYLDMRRTSVNLFSTLQLLSEKFAPYCGKTKQPVMATAQTASYSRPARKRFLLLLRGKKRRLYYAVAGRIS